MFSTFVLKCFPRSGRCKGFSGVVALAFTAQEVASKPDLQNQDLGAVWVK